MIKNAKDYKLDQLAPGVPNMRSTIMGWFQKLTFIVVTKKVIDFENVEEEREVAFMGVRQPMTAQQLQIKPEGQRAWKWETIHAHPDLDLNVDDRIKWGGNLYRVMERMDWTEYGYREYHIVQDYVHQE